MHSDLHYKKKGEKDRVQNNFNACETAQYKEQKQKKKSDLEYTKAGLKYFGKKFSDSLKGNSFSGYLRQNKLFWIIVVGGTQWTVHCRNQSGCNWDESGHSFCDTGYLSMVRKMHLISNWMMLRAL